jgi:TonB family protein
MSCNTYRRAIQLTLFICLCIAAVPGAMAQVSPASGEKVYTIADEMPAFDGDISDYTAKSLRYPDSARIRNEQGRSIVRFVVTKLGHIDSARIARTSGSAVLDEEAIRFIASMPNWKPGNIQDAPVAVYFSLPVNFVLDDAAATPEPPPPPLSFPGRKAGTGGVVSCNTDPNDTNIYTSFHRSPEFLFDVVGYVKQSLVFPDAAGLVGTGGRVEHRIFLDQRGYFMKVELHKSSGNQWLDAAANDAMLTLLRLNEARTAPCMPAIVNGKCVRSVVVFPTLFKEPAQRQQESGLIRNYRYRR